MASELAVINMNMATCPYNPAHRVSKLRLSKHIVKCAKNHKHLPTKVCPFNATHVVPEHQFKAHLQECKNNDVVHRDILPREDEGDTSSAFSSDSSDCDSDDNDEQVQKTEVADTEVWSCEMSGSNKQGGYDPVLASLYKPIVRHVPSGISKKQRQKWQSMEKQRIKELEQGLPFSSEVRAALKIPDHVQSDTAYLAPGEKGVPMRRPTQSTQVAMQLQNKRRQQQLELLEEEQRARPKPNCLQMQKMKEQLQREAQEKIQEENVLQLLRQQKLHQQIQREQKFEQEKLLKMEKDQQELEEEQEQHHHNQILQPQQQHNKLQFEQQANLQQQLSEMLQQYKSLLSDHQRLKDVVTNMELERQKEKMINERKMQQQKHAMFFEQQQKQIKEQKRKQESLSDMEDDSDSDNAVAIAPIKGNGITCNITLPVTGARSKISLITAARQAQRTLLLQATKANDSNNGSHGKQ